MVGATVPASINWLYLLPAITYSQLFLLINQLTFFTTQLPLLLNQATFFANQPFLLINQPTSLPANLLPAGILCNKPAGHLFLSYPVQQGQKAIFAYLLLHLKVTVLLLTRFMVYNFILKYIIPLKAKRSSVISW